MAVRAKQASTKRARGSRKGQSKPRGRKKRSRGKKRAAPPPQGQPDGSAEAQPQQTPLATDPQAWRLVDRLQLAQLLGTHPDTVTDYTRQGMPVVERGGRGARSVYDAVACLTWWRSQQGLDAKEAAQARAFSAAADLNELKVLMQRAALISREQVVREGQSYTKAWATKVRSLPRQLRLAGLITAEQEPAVAALCREVLAEIASWRTLADVQAVAAAEEAPAA